MVDGLEVNQCKKLGFSLAAYLYLCLLVIHLSFFTFLSHAIVATEYLKPDNRL